MTKGKEKELLVKDADELFGNFMKEEMKRNAGKFTEEEWEDKIPELYEQFANAPSPEFNGSSPRAYYALLGGEELCRLLSSHIDEDVAVPDLLCDALVASPTSEDGLMAFLEEGTDEELFSYAVNILREKGSLRPLDKYIEYVVSEDTDENVRELVGEMIIENAPAVEDKILSARKATHVGSRYLDEALAACPPRDEIFEILTAEFLSTKEIAAYAHILAKYGDDRAIDIIKQRIVGKIRYSDYIELKYAIEALGGEWTDDRDFSTDATFRKIKNSK